MTRRAILVCCFLCFHRSPAQGTAKPVKKVAIRGKCSLKSRHATGHIPPLLPRRTHKASRKNEYLSRSRFQLTYYLRRDDSDFQALRRAAVAFVPSTILKTSGATQGRPLIAVPT